VNRQRGALQHPPNAGDGSPPTHAHLVRASLNPAASASLSWRTLKGRSENQPSTGYSLRRHRPPVSLNPDPGLLAPAGVLGRVRSRRGRLLPGCRGTGMADVDRFRTTAELFRQLDDRFGGGHARQALVQYLRPTLNACSTADIPRQSAVRCFPRLLRQHFSPRG
jgi:hypothetical protein